MKGLIGKQELDNSDIVLINPDVNTCKSKNSLDTQDFQGKITISIYILDFYNKLNKFINEDDNNFLCFSGKAFNYIIQRKKELNEYINAIESSTIESSNKKQELELIENILQIISDKCKIFYRMQPNDKVRLVNFIKSNPLNIVAMCGDGANDCGALLCADVGISINFRENSNITSHFYSKGDSIKCVATVLQNGRACLENTIIIAKYLIVYSINKFVTVSVMYVANNKIEFTHNQYLFNDVMFSLLFCLVVSKTAARSKLTKSNLKGVFHVLISIITQALICNGLLVSI